MSPTAEPRDHAIRVFGPRGRRRVELDGVEMKHARAVTVEETVNHDTQVTVTFFTTRALVEPCDGLPPVPPVLEAVKAGA